MEFPNGEMIATNGIELEVFSAGTGQPLVLCHGWPEHAYSWRHQIGALAEAGYHVIVPNQRGYGRSTAPDAVEAYDIANLSADLLGVLDHFGYRDAVFIGHDWGAIVVWQLALLHPERCRGIVNLSVPYLQRGTTDWVSHFESLFGPDFYIVHFNRQPGVADRAFDAHAEQFLRNLYRTNGWQHPSPDLGPGMALINIAQRDSMPGDPIMTDAELTVFLEAFKRNTFTPGINWYRNFARNWQLLADVEERIDQPALVIHGEHDIPPSANLTEFVPNAEVVMLDCGHWIQQERPEETNRHVLAWLAKHYPRKDTA